MNAGEIAKGLTKAQREAVRIWNDRNIPQELARWLNDNLSDKDIRHIRSLGLATSPSLAQRKASYLTPLGLEVRAILAAQETNDE